MSNLKAFVVAVIVLLGFWLLLTLPVTLFELIAGAVVALLVALLPTGANRLLRDLRLTPRALVAMVQYLGVFLVELVKSTLDVASRVVRPSLPIRPGIVKIKTGLTTPLARLLLANSITLTPGTVTVETRGDEFFIHWIEVRHDDPEGATREIASRFERYLEVFLG